ncbi:16S rRNA (uracil(1498)-N(3))-methyltransferase [Luteimonas pelagia]
MRLTRIHVDTPLAGGLRVPLPDAAAGHLVRVLRLKEGDACVLFNGDGQDYPGRVASIGRKEVLVDVEDGTQAGRESPLRVTLLQGVARGEKMDWILQKAAELGVAAVLPVESERSEVKLEGSRRQRRVAHWQGVLASACEQCGRARVPEVAPLRPLAEALSGLSASDGRRLFLDPDARLALPDLRLEDELPLAAVLAVGPEGGWSPGDRNALAAAGFEGLRLGPRILRTETAGIAALAALQARWGDLG